MMMIVVAVADKRLRLLDDTVFIIVISIISISSAVFVVRMKL